MACNPEAKLLRQSEAARAVGAHLLLAGGKAAQDRIRGRVQALDAEIARRQPGETLCIVTIDKLNKDATTSLGRGIPLDTLCDISPRRGCLTQQLATARIQQANGVPSAGRLPGRSVMTRRPETEDLRQLEARGSIDPSAPLTGRVATYQGDRFPAIGRGSSNRKRPWVFAF